MCYRLTFVVLSMGMLFQAIVAHAQESRKVSVLGHVVDVETHTPLRGVSVVNFNSGEGAISDSSGTYRLSAKDFDWIICTYVGYYPDTVRVNALYMRQRIDVFLHRQKFNLNPVEIVGHKPNYSLDSMERRSWFSPALDQEKTHGLDAVAHPISGIYDAISGRQKRLWRFQKDYQQYEEEKYVRSRVRPGQVEQLFGLKGDSLHAFLLWYNPSYLFVRNVTDYDLLIDIKRAITLFRKVYKKNPELKLRNDVDRDLQ